jgi:acyl-CoA dehydrogenase
MQYAFAQMQEAFEGIVRNLEIPVLGGWWQSAMLLGWRLNPIGTLPSDRLGSQVAQILQQPGSVRDRLTQGIYLPTDLQQALGRIEHAFALVHQAEPILQKIKAASRAGQLPSGKPDQLLELAYQAGVINEAEVTLICEAEFARNDAIQVDAFSVESSQNMGRSHPKIVDELVSVP